MEHEQFSRKHLKALSDDDFEKEVQAIIAHARQHPDFASNAHLRKEVADAEKGLERFSEAVAHEAAVKLLHEVEIDEKIEELKKGMVKIRAAMIEAILSNHPKREEFLEMARKLVANEKAHDLHNPDDWKGLESLL